MYKRIAILVVALLMLVGTPSLSAYAANPSDPDVATNEQATLGQLINNAATEQLMYALYMQRGPRAELRDFASQHLLISAQNLGTLMGYLKTWYGNTNYTPEVSNENALMMKAVAGASDAQFESLWLDGMTKVQTEGVAIQEQYLNRATNDATKPSAPPARSRTVSDPNIHNRPELVAFTNVMLGHQIAERSQLMSWNCQWYNHCVTAPTRGPETRSRYSDNQ